MTNATDSFATQAIQRKVETRTQEIGREIFNRIAKAKPSLFEKNWWTGKVLDLSMRNEALKVQLFRFVDVLPCLKNSDDIVRHVQEYFGKGKLPSLFKYGAEISALPFASSLAAKFIDKQIREMARVFIVGENPEDAIPFLKKILQRGIHFTISLLGEETLSEREASLYREKYIEIIDFLGNELKRFSKESLNLSVKPSSLYPHFDAIDFEGTTQAVCTRVLPILEQANKQQAFIYLDMEHYQYKDLILAIFRQLLLERKKRGFEPGMLGIVLQAYLKETERDLESLLLLADEGAPFTVRLVKGAYWDYETIIAKQETWPIPVWEEKAITDGAFERITWNLLIHYPNVRAAFGSHNVRSLAHAIAVAEYLGVPRDGFEMQFLYGMGEPIKKVLVEMGYFVRNYAPIGELVPGMGYLVRRLLENTSNESFLRQRFAEGVDPETLLRPPFKGNGEKRI